ncbi:MAG TPA: HAD-IIIA family hydrolase [Bacteroidales bacterium]|nr:HAD-IIIA family hydrolase [Bacteroidales bacterium]HOH84859.1 HAD-IIIA family hydrolase [Bacteroidales bacterium]
MFPHIANPHSWTLFLDRDGVINKKLPDDYVKSWDEFEFLPFATASLARLRKYFGRIIVVSNQQGVGKGLMSQADLEAVHEKMCRMITADGGFINKIYCCTDLASSGSLNRKPDIGMALQAQQDFPEIDFSKSLMVGDALSDMEFAAHLGMVAVYIGSVKIIAENNKLKIDYVFNNLKELADFIYENNPE